MPEHRLNPLVCLGLSLVIAVTPHATAQAGPVMTPENLDTLAREQKRSHQLQLHQTMALTTLGLMAAEATLGLVSSRTDNRDWARPLHIALGGSAAGLYGATATLAYSVDPADGEAVDAIAWHRWLSYAHLATMVATIGLGYMTTLPSLPDGVSRETVRTWHGVMGGGSLGLMTASLGVLIFEF